MREHLEAMLDSLDKIVITETKLIPQLMAMKTLGEYFKVFSLPLKHLGKVKFDIDETFFDDEELAKKIIKDVAIILFKTYYNFLIPEYGEDIADKIFADLASGMYIANSGRL